MNKPIEIAIVGAGNRGLTRYAKYAENFPENAKVVAVAEPRGWFRQETVSRHDIPEENVFHDWRELAEREKLADAVIVATQDKEHTEPTLAFIDKGYDILLEKPMATTEQECRDIINAQQKSNAILAVCHVLRYTPYFKKIREIVQSEILGQIVTVRHMEQVGFWHHAHSYVRGNWRNTAESSPMILAKSCHDLDILLFLLGKRCLRLTSFGGLSHFKAENKPDGASSRCVDCGINDTCPYSATKFYGEKLKNGNHSWPLNVVTQDFSEDGLLRVLKEGPYGRCVYECDNDVVDHQVVNMDFEDGINVSFVMNAFTDKERRLTDIYGSHGELNADGKIIKVTNFKNGDCKEYDMSEMMDGEEDSHLGGDKGIMDDFVNAVRSKNQEAVSSTPQVSLMSHLMAFAAERSRLNGTIESISVSS